MTTKTITLFWKAFEQYGFVTASATADLTVSDDFTDEMVCERLFANTNLQQGEYWEAFEPILPDNRSHTSLSVGDEITIDGATYRCEIVGFSKLA